MSKLISLIVDTFGFDSLHDFMTSMVHFNLLKITIPISTVLGVFSLMLGFQDATTLAFFVMVVFELISGVYASLVEGKRIESRKFSRFGFKLLTWLVLMFVTSAYRNQYQTGVMSWVTELMNNTVVAYIMFEYVISIVENLERISGKEIPLKKYLITLFQKFINK